MSMCPPKAKRPRSDIAPRLRRILLVFLDGVGIAEGDPATNPLARAELPNLRALCGGVLPIAEDLPGGLLASRTATLSGIDANLGIPGLPQSGTGQTALLTGTNSARLLGRHFGPWVPTGLRDLLREESLFQQARRRDLSVAVANAYPRAHIDLEGGTRKRPGAFPYAAAAARVLDRDEGSLRRGDALVSSITTEGWRRQVDPDAPIVTPAEAGARLAGLASQSDLTVFAHYDTDLVGHRGGMAGAVTALERVDRFFGGLLDKLADDTLLLVSSDHGNVEDVRVGHTRNPALFAAAGPAHDEAGHRIRSVTDVTPTILYLLESRPERPAGK
ncbi:MAG TPA: alkaline phosphatase family protein [Longimicrobiaceae bacterium]|nr:alkaline phosphatase family protein [Longimicrobiaceae bacterium]